MEAPRQPSALKLVNGVWVEKSLAELAAERTGQNSNTWRDDEEQ
jgi:hypothetical protein